MSTADPAATILLVEDDGPTRTFLADNLTADGYDLLVADCARDGLRLLETKFPDVALVDLGLPDGSGLDIVRRVRASDGVASRIDPAVPLVVVSGRGGELDRLRGFDRGCDDYVCKAIGSSRRARRGAGLLLSPAVAIGGTRPDGALACRPMQASRTAAPGCSQPYEKRSPRARLRVEVQTARMSPACTARRWLGQPGEVRS